LRRSPRLTFGPSGARRDPSGDQIKGVGEDPEGDARARRLAAAAHGRRGGQSDRGGHPDRKEESVSAHVVWRTNRNA
jgi:hypothetical protein